VLDAEWLLESPSHSRSRRSGWLASRPYSRQRRLAHQPAAGAPGRVHLAFLPPASPELQPTEQLPPAGEAHGQPRLRRAGRAGGGPGRPLPAVRAPAPRPQGPLPTAGGPASAASGNGSDQPDSVAGAPSPADAAGRVGSGPPRCYLSPTGWSTPTPGSTAASRRRRATLGCLLFCNQFAASWTSPRKRSTSARRAATSS